jgi:DNA-binding response OmpR family regulator
MVMRSILIVDDDRNLRRLYKSELESEGYRVLLAENGSQATELLRCETPDLVIMDIRMPEVDGLEAMARILRENMGVPIILNSAYSCYQDNFLTWAAEGYLIKSADLGPLKRKIREVLSSQSSACATG